MLHSSSFLLFFQTLNPLPSPLLPLKTALITAAVDCEMCETARGLELTRLTIIDKDLTVILDTLVKPKNRIINYLTKYSGITEELLENVTVTLEQVQLAFMRLISKETYLIGTYLRYGIEIFFLFLFLSPCVDNDYFLLNFLFVNFITCFLLFSFSLTHDP